MPSSPRKWKDWGSAGAVPAKLTTKNRSIIGALTILSVVVLTPVLSHIGAAATWSDAFLLIGSLIAQVLMVYEKIESWVLWLIVDLVGTIQYAALGYWFTANLYAIFTLVAILGLKRWRDTYSN